MLLKGTLGFRVEGLGLRTLDTSERDLISVLKQTPSVPKALNA